MYRSQHFTFKSPSLFSRQLHLSVVGNEAIRTRRNIEIPLLDLSDSELADELVVPLPSSHLSDKIAGSHHIYGVILRRPAHKMMIDEAIENGGVFDLGTGSSDRAFGCIVSKTGDGLLGAVGCSAEIILRAALPEEQDKSDIGQDALLAVLFKGSFRFVVKRILKTFPYPVGIVDELIDDAPRDDDEGSDFARRILICLKKFIDQKLSEQENELTPLQKFILDENGVQRVDPTKKRAQAEEMAAIFDVFQSALIDDCPLPVDRYYYIGMMAAELIKVDNDMRSQMIAMTDGVARLRLLCEHMENRMGMNAVSSKENMQISDQPIGAQVKDLKVGEPQLPPWANEITKGTRLEYFWNEEWGWCSGTVSELPIKVVDEIILMVTFDSDGETHRLPLTADDKVRWRPEQRGSFE